jgi:hypothetical protein
MEPVLEEDDVHRSRRWLAALMMLGLVAAQLISVAHACAGLSGFAQPAHAMAGPAAAMPADCPGMADGTAPTDAACEAHCGPPEQAGNAADLRIPAMVPATPLIVRVAPLCVPDSLRVAEPLRARSAAPPLSLLFSRLLI